LEALEADTTAELIKESEDIERRLAETRQMMADNAALERRLAASRERAEMAAQQAAGREGDERRYTGRPARLQAAGREGDERRDTGRPARQQEGAGDEGPTQKLDGRLSSCSQC